MNVSLFQAAAAMDAQARWQEAITENLASASVPGFRKRDITFSQVEAGIAASGAGATKGQFHVPEATASINFQQGALRPTGNKFDFAINGPGFFEVQLPNGGKAYTRDGEFHIDATGQIVNKQGLPVETDGGALQVDPANPAPLSIAPDGTVSQGGEAKGKLRMVEFSDPKKLTPSGNGLFITGQSDLVPGDATLSTVRQGFLEAANTSPTAEMSNLISAMRLFEANQKVMTSQDERLGKVITELGSPT